MSSGDDWQTWFDRHGGALVLLARQFVGCRADAEDIVQDAFVRFWRSRERVNDPAAFVFACVRRCALDWQRCRQRQTQREERVARPETEPLFTAAEDNERRAAIEIALRELPAEQSELLVMKVWGELTFSQIAAALETSPNTAASRYRYALAKLREALAEEPTYE
jgi:RNA polymerase sigma-70 factor (ECF subfamily)